MLRKRRILISPMDWGLGHASRCIPLIRQKRMEGHDVFLAASGPSADLLSGIFPDLPLFRDIPAYNIHYSGKSFVQSIIRQLPHVFSTIHKEKKWLQKMIPELQIDEVISDNRYGLSSGEIQSVFITHQIFPIVPKWSEYLIHGLIRKYIEQFDHCLIPDFADEASSLAGRLSHGKIPAHCRYMGPLSRFKEIKKNTHTQPDQEQKGVLAIISGPEPQRTLFEKKIIEALSEYEESALIVCGQPGIKRNEKIKNITLMNHLNDTDMFSAILKAKIILCRSGYSTIMDLESIGRKAVLIPTPGQTEQEYLARYLSNKGYSFILQEELRRETLKRHLLIGQ